MLNVNSLANPDAVRTVYEEYYLKQRAPETCVSSHWTDYGPRADVEIDNEGNFLSFKGFGFGDLQYKDLRSRIVTRICNLSYRIQLRYGKDLRYLLRHAAEILKRIDGYVTSDSFRQTCGLCVARRHLDVGREETFNVVIIGDGYGFLSSLIKSVYPRARVTLIDLGTTLLFQMVNLQHMYPDCEHVLVRCADDDKADFDFRYVPAEYHSALCDVKYKLIFNICSMQEMNYETINGYFHFLRANATEDNLFYCCNRIHKELVGGEVIEVLKFPWREGDRHLVDEQCPFMKYAAAGKFPFFIRYGGPLIHRLTNLETGA